MLTKAKLQKLYTMDGLSMTQIAKNQDCSPNQVAYWMDKYDIKRRSISDAVYSRKHPAGHPFRVVPIDTIEKAKLFGMGVGLYWGEGTKANKHSVRLGNSDPELILTFREFLVELFEVDPTELRYGLQIFTDIDEKDAVKFWINKLNIDKSQLYKVHKTISGSLGTYRNKSMYGVVTIYFNNSRLRDIILGYLPR